VCGRDIGNDLRPAGGRADQTAARIEVGLRGFLEAGRFGAFTDTFEDLDGLVRLLGMVQRLMADGFGWRGG
jgi:L-arabinose isomerase